MGPGLDHILDGVSRATNQLILEEPFYGHYFVGLVKEVTTQVQTMAVGPQGGQVKLHINPDFWQQRLVNEKLRVGLIKHEILHVVLKHIFRAKDYKHKPLFNIACDLVVNQYIAEGALPADRLHIGLFPELQLAPEMDAHYYYQKLLPPFERLQDAQGDGAPSGDAEATLRELLGTENEWSERHRGWESLERMPTPLRELLEQKVTEEVRLALSKARLDKRWSQLPEGLRRDLDAIAQVEPPVVNWRRVLRMFAESSSRTYIRNTIRRPSKRFGTSPGIKVRQRQRLLLAIDTSGSIHDEELGLFFKEIYHIWKRGAEVLVVEADAAVQQSYAYAGQPPPDVKGGGGTDFDPVIRHANNHVRPDAIIYFTDGVAPVPKVTPRAPLLWVITSMGIPAGSPAWEALPGRKLKLTHGG